MSFLLGLLRNRFVVLGSGFILLISLAFTLGAWMGWSMTTRLYIVIGILVVSVGAAVVELVRSHRSASTMEDAMRWQAEQQVEHARPDKKREIEEMKRRFEDAVERLKRSKLGRGRRGSAALHALPWYLFIGPPSSGKTTAIQNSGLQFPIGTDRVRGVGGTRNCDWFFSDRAILLDTAGRYVTDTEDEKEWHTFLEMLRQNRPGRPINGVVVAISVADLLDADPYDVEWHASTIRRRITELGDQLGVRFPVYLMFTKCDLIRGFADFFRDLTQSEREQVWGCTFDDATPDDPDAAPPRTRFENAFDRLSDALDDLRLTRLQRSMKRDARHRVFVFPVEFAAMKETMASFVGHLFQPNPYASEPEFRGFYFTSGTQEGRPIDRVIRNVAERFDLPTPTGSDPEPDVETKSYFLRDLFTRVIIPDEHRVTQTSASVRSGRFRRAGVAMTAAVLLGVFALGASQAVVRSAWDVQRVEDAARAAAPVQWRANTPVGLAGLSGLLEEVDRLNDPNRAPSFRWGLSRHETVLAPARRLHTARMQPVVHRHLRTLERRLDAAGRLPLRSATTDSLRRETYADLRAVLLLTREHRRLVDSTEQQFLVRHLQKTAAAERWSAADATRHEAHLATFVRTLSAQPASPFRTDAAPIRRVRQRLLDVASLSPYDRLRADGLSSLAPLALNDLLPAEHTRLFAGNPEVPGLFTQAGWSAVVQPGIEAERTEAAPGDWVLGPNARRSPASAEEVADQMEQAYVDDYIAAWQRLLDEVRIRRPASLRETADLLQQLGHPDRSPLLYLFARVAEQTDFRSEGAAETIGDAIRASAETVRPDTVARAAAHPVTDAFAWLHALRPRQAVSDPSPQLSSALDALRRTGETLDELTGEPQPVLDFVATVLAEDGGDLDRSRTAVREGLARFDPALRRELFEQPLEAAWQTALAQAQTLLDARWEAEIARPFASRLASTYPFRVDAAADASLIDVETFFAPDTGTLDAFLDAELRPFYDVDRRHPRTWAGRGLDLSPPAVRFLDQSDRLQRVLFEGRVLRLTFTLQPDVPEFRPASLVLPHVRIRLHGVSDTYSMGTVYPIEFAWPGRPGASLQVEERRLAIPEKRFPGEWALIRLFEDARVRPTTSTDGRVRWTFEAPADASPAYRVEVRYDLRSARGLDVFADPRSFFRLSAPTALGS